MALRIPSRRQFLNSVIVTQSFTAAPGTNTTFENIVVTGISDLNDTRVKDLQVSNKTELLGDVNMYQDLFVLGNAHITNTLYALSNLIAFDSISSNTITALLQLNSEGNLKVSRDIEVLNDLVVQHDLIVNKAIISNLIVESGTISNLMAEASTLSNLVVNGYLNVYGTTNLTNLFVSNIGTFTNLIVTNTANLSRLTVTGTSNLTNLFVSELSTLYNLNVIETSTLSNLIVTGYSNLIGNLKATSIDAHSYTQDGQTLTGGSGGPVSDPTVFNNVIINNSLINLGTSNLQGLVESMQASIYNLSVLNETNINGLHVNEINFTDEQSGIQQQGGSYSTPNLQQVCELGNVTTSTITADSFLCTSGNGIKISDLTSSIILSQGIAIGKGADGTGVNSIAIGTDSVCSGQGSIVIGTGTSTGQNTLIINAGPSPLIPFNQNGGISNSTFLAPVRQSLFGNVLAYTNSMEVIDTGFIIYNGGIQTPTGNVITSQMLDKLYGMLL